jgi:hypothetical protein
MTNEEQIQRRKGLIEPQVNDDLKKPYHQLTADIYEELLYPNRSIEENMLHAQKRLVGLQVRTALEMRRLTLVATVISILSLIVALVALVKAWSP